MMGALYTVGTPPVKPSFPHRAMAVPSDLCYNHGRMKVNLLATRLDLTPSIKRFVGDKFGTLERLVKAYESEGEKTVFVEIARATKHHKRGDVFYAEATLGLPGKTLRAEFFDVDIRVAVDAARDALREEIKAYKGKIEERSQRKKK